jgi:hypothetical protein
LAALAGAAAGAAGLTRSIGIAVVVGVVVALAARRRVREAVAAALVAVLLLAPWQAFVAAHRGAVDPLIAANYGTYGEFLSQGGLQLSPASLLEVARPLAAISLPRLGDLLPLVAVPALAALVVGLALLPRRAPALGATLLAYLAIVAVWPYGPDRFLWAALPPLGVAFTVGAHGLWSTGGAPRVRGAARVVAVVAAAAAATGFASHQAAGLIRGDATATQRGISSTMQVMVDWVRRATDSSAVIAGEDEALLWLYTGREAVPNYLWRVSGRSSESLGPDSLLAWLERSRATHVILTGPGSDAAPTLDALLERAPGYLAPVGVWPGGLMAFEVRRPAPPASR